jgi:hypothetical protein
MARGDQVAKARKPKPVRRIYKTDHRRWKELSQRFKAACRSQNAPCWLHEYGMCVFHGAPIDYNAETHLAPMGFETDHAKPRISHPDLMFAWGNLRASHMKCNRTRGVKPVVALRDRRSSGSTAPQQEWVRPTW